MKTRRRAILILAELLLAAVLGWFLWGFDCLSRSTGPRNLQERFLLPREPELVQKVLLREGVLYEADVTDLVFDAGEEYLLVTDSFIDGSANRFYGAVFFPKDPEVTVIPAFDHRDDTPRLYAVGRVPGAAYAEAEVRVHREESGSGEEPFDKTYLLSGEMLENVTVFSFGDLYGFSLLEGSVLSRLETAAKNAPPWEPFCDLTLRYYGEDGQLLAEYQRSLKESADIILGSAP